MSNDKKNKSGRAGKISVWVLAILALIAVAVLLLKQDDCFPDPEPEPVPCKGSHCPVEGEATTGGVIVNPGAEGESTGSGSDAVSVEVDAVPSK